MNLVTKAYHKIHQFLCKDGLYENKYNPWNTHLILISTISTGLLMWGYAIIAYLYIDHPLPFYIGIITSLFHNFSPLLLRWPKSTFLSVNLMLLAGLLHQACYSYFSGGFLSPILIWFGILPLIAGLCEEKKASLFWFFTTILVAGIFFILEITSYSFPNLLNARGYLIGQILMVFGWIFLSFLLIQSFNLLKNKHLSTLKHQNEKIETLIRVLCHDISNPLMIIINKINQINLKDTSKSKLDLDDIKESVSRINQIVKQVRNWQAISDQKFNINAESMNLKDAIETSLQILQTPLNEKNISCHINLDAISKKSVLGNSDIFINHVFVNLLSNAIKFSNENEAIEVKAMVINHEIELTIQDNGIGIPQDLLENIFNAYKKTSRKGTKGEAGTGFGLPIVKEFLDQFDVKIQIVSPCINNYGTKIILTFKELPWNQ